MTAAPASEHQLGKPFLDPQAGGWLVKCSCGWITPRPTYYRANALRRAVQHMEDADIAAHFEAYGVART